jgi:hypothetical protein
MFDVELNTLTLAFVLTDSFLKKPLLLSAGRTREDMEFGLKSIGRPRRFVETRSAKPELALWTKP